MPAVEATPEKKGRKKKVEEEQLRVAEDHGRTNGRAFSKLQRSYVFLREIFFQYFLFLKSFEQNFVFLFKGNTKYLVRNSNF